MEQSELRKILASVRDGSVNIEDAVLKIREAPFTELGYAVIDDHRQLRQGFAEVIYGAGKTKEQILGIAQKMYENGVQRILITRISEEKAEYVREMLCLSSGEREIRYESIPQIMIIGSVSVSPGMRHIVVASGGTSDMPVAEEAALTAEVMGNRVVRLYDVGVSGLHRLLSHMDEIMSASVIIAVAGMEGALASVIGGLADCPVIAVPTSVGYGANFNGLSALLSMLNSCASGVSVVNIDNGFGAGYQAAMINRMSNTAAPVD